MFSILTLNLYLCRVYALLLIQSTAISHLQKSTNTGMGTMLKITQILTRSQVIIILKLNYY